MQIAIGIERLEGEASKSNVYLKIELSYGSDKQIDFRINVGRAKVWAPLTVPKEFEWISSEFYKFLSLILFSFSVKIMKLFSFLMFRANKLECSSIAKIFRLV